MRDRTQRIGRWKEAVSRVQRKRKKRYCRRIGCVARKLEWSESWSGRLVVLEPEGKGGSGGGGGGERGRDGEVGVAFSIRAQVR